VKRLGAGLAAEVGTVTSGSSSVLNQSWRTPSRSFEALVLRNYLRVANVRNAAIYFTDSLC
jgi:hypothetical protein